MGDEKKIYRECIFDHYEAPLSDPQSLISNPQSLFSIPPSPLQPRIPNFSFTVPSRWRWIAS